MRYGLLTGVLLIVAGLVTADYYGLLGTREQISNDVLHPRFKLVEKGTGKSIDGVHIQCFIGRKEGACSSKPEEIPGLVELNFVVARADTRTWLFKKSERFLMRETGTLTLAFLHPDYVQYFLPVDFKDIPGLALRETMIELTPAGS
jgi:hypothetical protein